MVREKGIATIRVPYRAVIDNANEAAKRVKKFLALELDVDKMAQCVDPSLYRNRAESKISS